MEGGRLAAAASGHPGDVAAAASKSMMGASFHAEVPLPHLHGARRGDVPAPAVGQLASAGQAGQRHKGPAVGAQVHGTEEPVLGCRLNVREQGDGMNGDTRRLGWGCRREACMHQTSIQKKSSASWLGMRTPVDTRRTQPTMGVRLAGERLLAAPRLHQAVIVQVEGVAVLQSRWRRGYVKGLLGRTTPHCVAATL